MYLKRFIGKTGALNVGNLGWRFVVDSNFVPKEEKRYGMSGTVIRHTLLDVEDDFVVFVTDYDDTCRQTVVIPLNLLCLVDYAGK
jgi:hypothetical protein